MNFFKSLYCRVFQSIMRCLSTFFPFKEPILLDGIDELINVLKEKKINNLIIITDKIIRNIGLTKKLEDSLEKECISFCVYDNTNQNPTSNNVEEARELYLLNKCNAIIAFGGGSSLDCAKALGARIVLPNKDLKSMQGLIKINKKLPLLIAIPTTAGSGSETTVASVITDSNTHYKYVINDFCLIPEYALMLPEVTKTLPKHITSTTGMDALTHAIEVYVGLSMTEKSKKAAEEAIKLIFENLEKAYEDGEDLNARKNMLYASYLAGTAFTRSYVGYVHAIAHTLGGKYNVPHGLANAVLLPHILTSYGGCVTKPLSELARLTNLIDETVGDEEGAKKFIDEIFKMNERMNVPLKLDCVKKEDIANMAKLADKEANPLYPVPVLWDEKELEKIYYQICNEK